MYCFAEWEIHQHSAVRSHLPLLEMVYCFAEWEIHQHELAVAEARQSVECIVLLSGKSISIRWAPFFNLTLVVYCFAERDIPQHFPAPALTG